MQVETISPEVENETTYPDRNVGAGRTSKGFNQNKISKWALPFWKQTNTVPTYREVRPINRSNLLKIRHKLPNWIALPIALTILPLLFFSMGRVTADKSDNASAYYADKESVLGLGASPEPKVSAEDYLTEAREAFTRAQEISKEQELSDEDKNKVTNLINLAIQTLSDGITKHPSEAALYFERATIYKALSQAAPEMKEKFRADLEKTLELAPNATNALALYGRFLVEEMELEKAKTVFDQLLALLPQNSQDYQTVAGWRQQLEPTPTPTDVKNTEDTENNNTDETDRDTEKTDEEIEESEEETEEPEMPEDPNDTDETDLP